MRNEVTNFTQTNTVVQRAYPYYMQGTVWTHEGEYQNAIPCYTRALEIEPNLPEALFDRGMAFLFLENRSLGIQDLKRVLELSPQLFELKLKELKQDRRGIFNRRSKQMQQIIEIAETLLSRLKQGFSLDDIKQAKLSDVFSVICNLISPDADVVEVLTYRDVVSYALSDRPIDPNCKKGAVMKQTHPKGFLVTQVFLDSDNELVCKPDGAPYGRKLVVKNFDPELLEYFGDKKLLILD